MEIMFSDLKPVKQQELLEYLGLQSSSDGNYDIMPLFVLSDINTEPEKTGRIVLSFLTTK